VNKSPVVRIDEVWSSSSSASGLSLSGKRGKSSGESSHGVEVNGGEYAEAYEYCDIMEGGVVFGQADIR
jgi:hypothetical protein